MNSESLHVAGRLLEHRCARTTNLYVHLDDATLMQVAECGAEEIQQKLRLWLSTQTKRTDGNSALRSR
ncbi:MAG: hypothetical protein F4Z97_05515 [Gammaproteobacteria bacterium]|nr:hypothetical protein [Gammaproteobacteria bacterium]